MEDQIRDMKAKGEMGECRIYIPHLIGYFRAALPMSSPLNTVLYLFSFCPGNWHLVFESNFFLPFLLLLN